MDILIRSGRIIDPGQGIDCIGDVLVVNGRIAQIGEQVGIPESQCAVFNAIGMVVSPGFIDLHCHLRQPGFEEKETIASGTMAAAHGGFTTICCMPNTNPPIDTKTVIERINEIARWEGMVRVLPIGAVTRGRNGETLTNMLELSHAGAVAFSDDGSPVRDSRIMRQALKQSKTLGIPIIDHCEELTLSKKGVMNDGAVAARLGYQGIPAAAEERMIVRDIDLARETGGKLHIAHVSTAGSVALIRQAKQQGVNITAEATPHHLTLTEDAVVACGTSAKVNPPLRTRKDVDILVDGLHEGIIDAIATDHAPHTETDKRQSFEQSPFGISGFETALGSLMLLVHQGDIDLKTLISRMTLEPAMILGNSQVSGTLKAGSTADITIFDPYAEWKVNPSEFVSKGKNTPLAGTVLKGKVMATIVAGEMAYRANP